MRAALAFHWPSELYGAQTKAGSSISGGNSGNVLSRFVETNPDQTMALLHMVGFCPRLGGYFTVGGQRGNLHASAVRAVIPAMVGTDELIAIDPPQRQRCAAMEAEIIERRDCAIDTPEHQRLVEELDRHGFVGQIFRPQDGIPKLPENIHAYAPDKSITDCISRLWHGCVKRAPPRGHGSAWLDPSLRSG